MIGGAQAASKLGWHLLDNNTKCLKPKSSLASPFLSPCAPVAFSVHAFFLKFVDDGPHTDGSTFEAVVDQHRSEII